MDFDANYVKQCALPGIEPAAIEEIINETSGYNELALKIATKDGQKAVAVRQPTTVAAMVETVTPYMRTGADVRFGVMLIPARFLPELKVSVAQATEPCTNIRIGSLIYKRAREIVSAGVRDPRDLALQTRLAYLAGSHNGRAVEGLTAAGPVVVAKPPRRDFERGEAAKAAEAGAASGASRRVAQAYAGSSPGFEAGADAPPRLHRAADAPAREPTLFEVTSAPMTIDLSRFREAR